MSKELDDFKAAVDGLKSVAQALHVPFDTSEVERTAKALDKSNSSSSSAPASKPVDSK